MEIASIRSKALKRLWLQSSVQGVPSDQLKRLRSALATLAAAADLPMLMTVPGWRLHELKGDRKGTWSMSVTGNWRLMFRAEGEIIYDLDLEDYH